MRENLAELIVGDLADEAAACTQRSEPRQRVGRRAAADFLGRAHRVGQFLRARGIDQRHPALGKAKPFDAGFVGGGHDIDDGVADGDDVNSGHGKGLARSGKARA